MIELINQSLYIIWNDKVKQCGWQLRQLRTSLDFGDTSEEHIPDKLTEPGDLHFHII